MAQKNNKSTNKKYSNKPEIHFDSKNDEFIYELLINGLSGNNKKVQPAKSKKAKKNNKNSNSH